MLLWFFSADDGSFTGPQCYYAYCWLCLADYDEIREKGNSSHAEGCRLHTDNLPGGFEGYISDPSTDESHGELSEASDGNGSD